MVSRNTVQFSKILSFLERVKSHPNAEAVFLNVKKDIPNITLATVYRNLDKLSSQGKALKLEVNGEFRFDADTSFHQHAVCSGCGEIIDLFQKEISQYALNKFKYCNSCGFSAKSVNIIFHGLCKKCFKQSKS